MPPSPRVGRVGIRFVRLRLGGSCVAGLDEAAERLRRDFEAAFWCEELSTYAIALDGAKRPCRLAPTAMTEIDQWLGMLRQALAANYNRLDDVLAAMKTEK